MRLSGRPSRSLLPLPMYFAQSLAGHTDILSHFFGLPLPHAPAALDDAIIIGLDAEWFTRGEIKHVTELGIAILDPTNHHAYTDDSELVKFMEVFHARIIPNAHLVNRRAGAHADKFLFGTTKFITLEEAEQLLTQAFCRPKANGYGYRPVILLGHAVDNDTQLLQENFGVDLREFGTIIKTIDTQIMAEEVGVQSDSPLIGLKDLLKWFGIQEKYLHTAGNDIVYTMAVALLLSSYPDMDVGYAIYRGLEELKVNGTLVPTAASWGITVFCTKCNSTSHMANNCSVGVTCFKCVQNPRNAHCAHTHMTEKCIAMDIENRTPTPDSRADPCTLCMMSGDFKRWSKAQTHVMENCAWARRLLRGPSQRTSNGLERSAVLRAQSSTQWGGGSEEWVEFRRW